MHTAKYLKSKKSYRIFHMQKYIYIYILACILALITSLLKSREHWPKSQKITKYFILFDFSIKDYEFIRKSYS